MNTELFNWYIDKLDETPHIAGDIVKHELRHQEYTQDMLNRVSKKEIAKKDEAFKRANSYTIASELSASGRLTVVPKDREMVFIREKIVAINGNYVTTKKGIFKLMNQDSFFLNKRGSNARH
jgi:hypothetical protein